jgi:hypothetical protein
MSFKTLFISAFLFSQVLCGQSYKGRTTLGVDYAKEELKSSLKNTTSTKIPVDTLIKDKETAIRICEAILFKVYGKDNITSQQPYEINLIDGYWVLNGTLPENMLGGTFLIIIHSTNGEVIRLTHGK